MQIKPKPLRPVKQQGEGGCGGNNGCRMNTRNALLRPVTFEPGSEPGSRVAPVVVSWHCCARKVRFSFSRSPKLDSQQQKVKAFQDFCGFAGTGDTPPHPENTLALSRFDTPVLSFPGPDFPARTTPAPPVLRSPCGYFPLDFLGNTSDFCPISAAALKLQRVFGAEIPGVAEGTEHLTMSHDSSVLWVSPHKREGHVYAPAGSSRLWCFSS